MIEADLFLNFLKKKKINFFSGVPDSVLKYFSNAIDEIKNHFIKRKQ